LIDKAEGPLKSAWSNPGVLRATIAVLALLLLLAWHPWRQTQTRTVRVVSHFEQGYSAGETAGFKSGYTAGIDAGCELAAGRVLPAEDFQGLRDAGTLGSWCKRIPRLGAGR
jgi:hypothetical protein